MTTFRLYKYLSISKPEHWNFRRKLLVDRELYFSDPSTFNDPLDCALADGNPAKHLLPVKVNCLSREDRDDSLMFAHYGDQHRGFRLTFEVSEGKPNGECHPLELGQDVLYVKELPTFSRDNVSNMLLTKSESWSYEAEYRVFNTNDKQLKYPVDCLIEVAFGYRMNRDFEPILKAWIKEGRHQRVTFVRAVQSRNLVGFDYIKA